VITPDGRTAYVADSGTTVTPINTATNAPGKPIQVGVVLGQIAVTPDGKTVYASSAAGPGTVVPISTATNMPGQPIRIGGPGEIVITP
jgi:DNA-binding beta-propeller fold protein YncE